MLDLWCNTHSWVIRVPSVRSTVINHQINLFSLFFYFLFSSDNFHLFSQPDLGLQYLWKLSCRWDNKPIHLKMALIILMPDLHSQNIQWWWYILEHNDKTLIPMAPWIHSYINNVINNIPESSVPCWTEWDLYVVMKQVESRKTARWISRVVGRWQAAQVWSGAAQTCLSDLSLTFHLLSAEVVTLMSWQLHGNQHIYMPTSPCHSQW